MTGPAEKHRELLAAVGEVRDAKQRLADTLARLYPAGTDVRWNRGGHVSSGMVLANYRGYDALYARNKKTGKIIKIGSYDILEAAQ